MIKKITSQSYVVFGLVALFLFYEMGVQVSPSVMTSQLMEAWNVGAVGLGLITSFYFYTYTIMQIPAGLLLDRFGVRQIILTALLVCAIGAALFGSTHSIVTASLARMLMGFGSAFAFVSVLAVAERWFPARYFALLAGMAQLFAALGAMSGELPVAFVVDHLGWRQTMFILAIMSLVLVTLIVFFVREPKNIVDEPVRHCDDGILKGLHVILKDIQTWTLALYAFLNWAPMAFFASLWGVPYLQASYGLSNSESASLMGLVWIGIGLGSPIIGYISDLIGRRNLLLQLSTLLGLIVSLMILYGHQLNAIELGILLFLLGVSCSGQVLSFAVVKDNAHPSKRATAIAINNMAVVAAGALFLPMVGYLLNQHHQGLVHVYSAGDYQYAMLLLPVVYGLGLVVSFFGIRETFCRSQASN